MDRAAIFTTILRRNAARLANGISALDVRAEYGRQVSITGQQDYRTRCNEHAADREAIRLEVLAELQAEHGPNFGGSMGGRWAVGELTRKRFAAFMAIQFGEQPHRCEATLSTITYGGSRDATASD
jgi:hypothetical protein